MLRLIALLATLLPFSTGAADVPQRIISLGSSVTETVYALGEDARLVGRDSTSLYPAAVHKLPDVGYLRTLGAEGILSLEPDLILASHEAGPPQVLEQLRSAGVHVEVLTTGPTVEQALVAIEQTGELLGQAEAGQALAQKNRTELKSLHSVYGDEKQQPRVLFVLGGHGAQPTISGGDTKANTMIELAMGINAATGFTSYRPASAEALLGMQPDVVVAASHGVTQTGGIDQLMQDSGLNHTPAGQQGRIVVMDSVLMLGMGPRLGEAATELARRIRKQGE